MFVAWVTTNLSQRIVGRLVQLPAPVTFILSQLGFTWPAEIDLPESPSGVMIPPLRVESMPTHIQSKPVLLHSLPVFDEFSLVVCSMRSLRRVHHEPASAVRTIQVTPSAHPMKRAERLSANRHHTGAMKKSDLRSTFLVSVALLGNLFLGGPVWAASCPVVTFFATGTFSAGTNPVFVAIGEFNGDGKPDLVVANAGTGNISVLLANGDGTFQPPVSYGGLSGPSSVAVGDFNGDGKRDLAVANTGTTNVSVLLGNGNGTFQAPLNYGAGETSQSVAVGDFNVDGKLDLAVANRVSANVSVLLGNGNGTFQDPVSYDVGTDPLFVAVGDFNGDGKPDLAVANSALFDETQPSVSILLNNGNGTFQAAVNYGAGMSPRSIAVGDFNSDGKLDLAVANYGGFGSGQFAGSSVSVWLGNGNGTFQTPVDYGAGEGPISVGIGDFRGNGRLDLAVANDRSASASVLLGNSNGTFQAAMNYGTGTNPRSVAVGDLNNDGRPDLAVANLGGVSVLLSTCVTTADLGITLTGSPPVVLVGQNLTYTIIATNAGAVAGNDVVVSDTLPSGVSFVSANTTQGTATLSNNVVIGNLGTLNAGSGATITIVVTATTSGSLTNFASISGSGAESNTDNNTDVVVNSANSPPTISSIADQVVNEDTPTGAITITIGDMETNPSLLTLSSVSSNTNLVTAANFAFGGFGANRNVTITPLQNRFGITTNTITVSDGSATASTTFVLTVNSANDPPSFVKGANQTGLEDAGARTVSGWATAISAGPADEAGQSVTFLVSNNNNGLFSSQPAVAVNGTLTYTPASNANGSATVTVQLQDNGGTANGGINVSPAQTFTITVTAVNDAPAFTKGSNQTIAENLGPQTFPGWATAISAGPPNEAAQTLTFLVSNNNTTLFSMQPAIASNGTLTYTTATNASGTATVTVQLQDNGGTANGGVNTTAPQTFTITVSSVNSPPVLAALANQTVNEGASLALTASATDPDVPANTLTFTLDPGAPAGLTINGTTGALSWTPTEAQGPSTNTVTVRVTDNGSPPLSDAKSFTVTVNEVNTAPVLAVIANQTINEGATLSLSISATDADIPANTLTFSVDPGAPAGMTINVSSGALSWTPSEAQGPSTNTVTVRVTDSGSPALSDAKSFLVVVNEVNAPPVLAAIANQTVNEGSLLTLTASASDPDLPANTLTFSLLSPPAGASINAGSGVFTWTPSEAQGPGSYTIMARVMDSASPSLSATQSFTVTVNDVNNAPVLAAIANQTINEGATLSLTVSATDPDVPANTLTYSLDPGAPAGASINASIGVFTWTTSEAQGPSSSTIMLRVTDNGVPSLSDVKSFTVTVNEVNSTPALTAIPNQTINEGGTLTLAASASDPDLPAN